VILQIGHKVLVNHYENLSIEHKRKDPSYKANFYLSDYCHKKSFENKIEGYFNYIKLESLL